jgi:MOSC domain-containing protein YiiM
VAQILLAGAGGEPMRSVEQADVVAGAGLAGDRYAAGTGTYSDRPGGGRHVTLVEAEAVAAVTAETGIPLEPGDTRRNLVTEGVALNHLVGREFAVGDVVLRGTRLCEPCALLERRTRPGVRQALLHRAGLRAEVVVAGTIRVGDRVAAVTPPIARPARMLAE